MPHPTLQIAPGVHMPFVGLGTWRMSDAEAESSCRLGLELGYRHIDTASLYKNEAGVGRAVRASGLPREQVFVTTKCWNDDIRGGHKAVLKAFDASLHRLDLGYIDLYLLHWPVKGKSVEAWKAMQEILASGRCRAVGVSNYMVHHLQELLDAGLPAPANNQVELNPRLQLPELMAFSKRMGISVTAWAPLMVGKVDEVPELVAIAKAHGRTPSQVALRWNVQTGVITIPKTTRRERLIENADLFDFSLTDAELRTIASLDRHQRTGPDPDNFNF